MVTMYVPPPCADEVMTAVARRVSRRYNVKVTVGIESFAGESTAVFDGRPQQRDALFDGRPQPEGKAPGAMCERQQEQRDAFTRLTGRIATIDVLMYFAFCKGISFGRNCPVGGLIWNGTGEAIPEMIKPEF